MFSTTQLELFYRLLSTHHCVLYAVVVTVLVMYASILTGRGCISSNAEKS